MASNLLRCCRGCCFCHVRIWWHNKHNLRNQSERHRLLQQTTSRFCFLSTQYHLYKSRSLLLWIESQNQCGGVSQAFSQSGDLYEKCTAIALNVGWPQLWLWSGKWTMVPMALRKMKSSSSKPGRLCEWQKQPQTMGLPAMTKALQKPLIQDGKNHRKTKKNAGPPTNSGWTEGADGRTRKR